MIVNSPRIIRLIILATVIILVTYMVDVHKILMTTQAFHQHLRNVETGSRSPENVPSGYILHTPGCKIQDLNPFDPSIREFLKDEPKFRCSSKPPLLHVHDVKINVTSYRHYQVKNESHLYCCYRVLRRGSQNLKHYNTKADSMYSVGKECKKIERDGTTVYDEFILAVCKYQKRQIYKNGFAFVLDKKLRTSSRVPPGTEEGGPEEEEDDPPPLSILLVGIDSVSRLNLQRAINKTADYLRQRGALELYGYVKVGDNTFPNVVVELTGLDQNQLKKVCWKSSNVSFDACPFIWRNFSDRGYVTAFAEDAPTLGTFTFKKTGFVIPPTDYYPRPFNLAVEKELSTLTKETLKVCVGDRLSVDVVLQYAQDFVSKYHRKKFFGWFWTSTLTHNTVNTAPLAEGPYLQFFTRLFSNEVTLNRTMLVFFSDHGIRFGDIRKTYVGWLEERMPFFMVWVPPWFRSKHPEVMANLRTNTRRLTSPFDLHCTLTSVLLNRFDPMSCGRGFTLFHPIPVDRTCPQAGIDPHWCTCKESQEVDPRSPEVMRVARFLLDRINNDTKDDARCAKLSLDKVVTCRVSHEESGSKVISDYLVSFQTLPGKAVFEATVGVDRSEMKMLGPVSRLNTYEGQSECVEDYELKKYCYCLGTS